MKLKRENFKKLPYNNGVIYQYDCEGNSFFLRVVGKGRDKNMSVWKGGIDDIQDRFDTKDTLEAWNKFEDYIQDCQRDEQGSSGGFAKDPQQNPDILPLLAMKQNPNGVGFLAYFFAVMGNQQKVIFSFELTSDALGFPFSDKIIIANWRDEEIPALFKCEVVLKSLNDIEFEDDKECTVFLFIPKSIVTQGGETDEKEPSDEDEGEPSDNDDPNKKKSRGKPSDQDDDADINEDEDGDDEDEDEDEGEPSDNDDPNKKKSRGKPSDQDDEDENEGEDEDEGEGEGEGEPTDDRISNDTPRTPIQDVTFSDAITAIAEVVNQQPSSVVSVFRTQRTGEAFLQTKNFNEIKTRLNLSPDTTIAELTTQIINSK
jgi:hypothetical protein